MRIVGLAVLVLTAAIAFATPFPPPPNDECTSATVVDTLPFTEVVDTTLAKPTFTDDSYMSCGPGGGPTVWYEFIPPKSGTFCAKTCGSDYDTVVAAVQGGCTGGETSCNDDTCFLQSHMDFEAIVGVPVMIVVGSYAFTPFAAPGGYLTLAILDETADSDGDGELDCSDLCPSVVDPLDGDADDDGVGDVCDPCNDIGSDFDGDGICGFIDRCPDVASANQADADGDLVGDVCDACPGPGGIDADGDGVCDDADDNCLGVSNPGQEDADLDYVGDACDACTGLGGVDADGDGVCDEADDNCPTVANPDQLDSDGDFIGDVCDQCPGFPGSGTDDADGDSHPDVCDACPDDPTEACAILWACIASIDDDLQPSILVRVNPATGRSTAVGSMGTSGCRGLAFEPGTGRLLALARSIVDVDTWDLFEVDPTTAAVTRIGPTTNTDAIGGMTFRPDGALFALIENEAYRVDPANGVATLLGGGFVAGYPSGLTFDGNGELLAVDGNIFSIDQTSGVATYLQSIDEETACPDFSDLTARGLALENGILRLAFECDGYDSSGVLGDLDAVTGVVTTAGATARNLAALTAETCGNGTVEGGEECDDGNTSAGDCCSPTCRIDAAGTPCADDGAACTADACDGAGTCTHLVPAAAGCAPATSRRAAITITPGADPKLQWRWRGTVADQMTFGPPTSATALTLCVVDAGGTLLASATAPQGGLCQNGDPCWRPKPTGYDYLDRDRTPDGLEKVTLRASPTPGKARIKVKGRGTNLSLVSPPYAAPVRVRLVRNDGGACWEATYSVPSRNTASVFKAKSD